MSKFTALLLFLLNAPFLLLQAADPAPPQSGIHQPVTSREVDQLKRQILDSTRSSVEAIFEYRNENGDVNNRLDYWRYGGRLNYRWTPSTMLYLQGAGTSYQTLLPSLDEIGVNATAGVRHSLSEQVETQLEAGATRFTTKGSTVNALGSLQFKTSEGTSLYITGSRTNVEESLLSSAGIRPLTGPFAGRLVGQVMDNRATVGARYKLPGPFDVFGEGAVGNRTGKNIESNFFRQAGGGLGYNVLALSGIQPMTLLRASYEVLYFGFDKDLLGYGGASLVDRRGRLVPLDRLGSDGISPDASQGHAGVGGYFSPARFISNVGRLEVQGHPVAALEYRISGFLGAQNFTGSDTRRANGFSGTLTVRLSDRFSLPITYLLDNIGPFRQQSVFFRLVARL